MAISNIRQTHTYAILTLSRRSFFEIKRKLKDAGYENTFYEEGGDLFIPMQGIAVNAKSYAGRKHNHSKGPTISS